MQWWAGTSPGNLTGISPGSLSGFREPGCSLGGVLLKCTSGERDHRRTRCAWPEACPRGRSVAVPWLLHVLSSFGPCRILQVSRSVYFGVRLAATKHLITEVVCSISLTKKISWCYSVYEAAVRYTYGRFRDLRGLLPPNASRRMRPPGVHCWAPFWALLHVTISVRPWCRRACLHPHSFRHWHQFSLHSSG